MARTESSTSIINAIHQRTSVRTYTPQKLDHGTILTLLEAATRAPTAIDEEPWEFVIVQDEDLLKNLSDRTKELFLEDAQRPYGDGGWDILDDFAKPDFNIFYNASTLIIICARPNGKYVVADCWLAAENLMLAASSLDLGSCIIGSAVTAINTPEIKEELGIPADLSAVVPIIVGIPDGETPPTSRMEPKIISWK